MFRKVLLIGALVSSFSLVACQSGMEPINLTTGDSAFDNKFELGSVENNAIEAEKMAKATEEALSKISVDLNIDSSDISIFKIGKLKDKLKDVERNLRNSFSKLDLNLQSLRDKLDQVRAELEARIADLDPNDPYQAKVIEQAKRMIEKMDFLELKLDNLVERLTSLLDRLGDKIDNVIMKVTSKLGLLGIPVQMILEDMKNNMLDKLKEKLLEVIGIQ